MNSRAARAMPVPRAELGDRRDDRRAGLTHGTPGAPGVAQDRERALVAARAQALDGAAADHVLERRAVEQRGSSASACGGARPAQRQRRLGLDEVARRRRGAAGRPARAPAARRRGTRRARRHGAAHARVLVVERRQQRVARVVAPGLAERARRGAPARPRSRSPRSAAASAATPAGSASSPSARAAATRSIASRAAASCRRHSAAFFSSRSTSARRRPGSKITCVGRAGRRNSNVCVASRHVDALVVLAAVDLEAHRGGELEQRRLGVIVCFCAMRSVPTLRSSSHSQRPSSSGWPGARDPPVEKLVDVAPGRLLDGARQIARLDRAVRVLARVVARAPSRSARRRARGAACAARARPSRRGGVEDVDRLVVLPADDRPPVAPGLVR